MPETSRRMLRIPRRPGGRFGDLPPRHAGHEAPLVTPACSASADKHFNPGPPPVVQPLTARVTLMSRERGSASIRGEFLFPPPSFLYILPHYPRQGNREEPRITRETLTPRTISILLDIPSGKIGFSGIFWNLYFWKLVNFLVNGF